MLSAEVILYGLVGVFIFQLICHALINPQSLYRAPTSDRTDEMVENRGSRAMGIFAVVLVVVNFIISPSSSSSIVPSESTALVTTLFSAGFLMIAFILEVYG